MKICQPIEKDQGLDNVLHGHFRTSPRFAIFDNEVKHQWTLERKTEGSVNDVCEHANLLNEQKVDVAIVGGISRCGLEKLHHLGIRVFQASGQLIGDNISAFQKGELKELTFENITRGFAC
jgi:predicted Fe-Mo cluster-binding NifX family protein